MTTVLYGGGYKGKYEAGVAFTNQTSYQVGQIRSGRLVTAIVRLSTSKFNVYTVPKEQVVKLNYLIEQQTQREKGSLKAYLTGTATWTVTI